MVKTIQIRDVPEEVHAKLKLKAADAGMSLSSYLNIEIARFASLPTQDEMLARLAALKPSQSRVSSGCCRA